MCITVVLFISLQGYTQSYEIVAIDLHGEGFIPTLGTIKIVEDKVFIECKGVSAYLVLDPKPFIKKDSLSIYYGSNHYLGKVDIINFAQSITPYGTLFGVIDIKTDKIITFNAFKWKD